MTKDKRWNSHKVHSIHVRSSLWEAHDTAQRDYNPPIHSQEVIPYNYDHENDGDKYWNKVKEGDILVVEAG